MTLSKLLLISSVVLITTNSYGEVGPVYPNSLNGKETYELGQFVKLMMPEKNQEISWDWQANNKNIVWLDKPYREEYDSEYYENGMKYVRRGFVRISTLGKKATILQTRNTELGWKVIYSSENYPKFGVDRISLFPADNLDREMFDQSVCFDMIASNCEILPLNSLKTVGINAKLICNSNGTGKSSRIYRLSAPNKKSIYLHDYSTGGSGGIFNQYISLLLEFNEKTACQILGE